MVNEVELISMVQLNAKLLETLAKTTLELINYAKEHDYELPYKVHSLLKDARKLYQEIINPSII